MRLKSVIAILLAASVFPSCVMMKSEGEQMMADISRLKTEIATLQRERSDFEITANKKYDRMQSRVSALESSTYKKATNESSENDQLRRELEQLRGELEETQKNLGTRSDLPTKEKEVALENIPTSKKDHFSWCKEAFEESDFDTALVRVNSFIEKYRDDNVYGAKAYLLRGDVAVELANNSSNEAAKKDFYKKAVTSYQDLLTRFPKSDLIPEGLYKVGETLEAMGFKKDAQIFFDEIRTKHAKSSYAKKAIKKIASLSKKNKNG